MEDSRLNDLITLRDQITRDLHEVEEQIEFILNADNHEPSDS
jgi:hypothetical protein